MIVEFPDCTHLRFADATAVKVSVSYHQKRWQLSCPTLMLYTYTYFPNKPTEDQHFAIDKRQNITTVVYSEYSDQYNQTPNISGSSAATNFGVNVHLWFAFDPIVNMQSNNFICEDNQIKFL